jgi:hypothetical protein
MSPKHSAKRTIKALDVIRDIRSGLEESAVMTKYSLTAGEFSKVFRQITAEAANVACSMAHDILSGIPAKSFIKKYRISAHQLHPILRRLMEGDFVSHEDLRRWKEQSLTHQQLLSGCYPLFRIDLCEVGNPRNVGEIINIDECGFGAVNLQAEIGVTKSYAILGDEFGRVDPLEFEATCLWVGTKGSEGRRASDFEIKRIDAEDLRLLRKLLSLAPGVGFDYLKDPQ